jgi:hypothetical protein
VTNDGLQRDVGVVPKNLRKSGKSNLQSGPIGVFSPPFVHTQGSRLRNSWPSFDGASRMPDILSTNQFSSSLVMSSTKLRVSPSACSQIRPGDVMRVPRVVRPPRDKAWFVPV